jgi:hypothetical protein
VLLPPSFLKKVACPLGTTLFFKKSSGLFFISRREGGVAKLGVAKQRVYFKKDKGGIDSALAGGVVA